MSPPGDLPTDRGLRLDPFHLPRRPASGVHLLCVRDPDRGAPRQSTCRQSCWDIVRSTRCPRVHPRPHKRQDFSLFLWLRITISRGLHAAPSPSKHAPRALGLPHVSAAVKCCRQRAVQISELVFSFPPGKHTKVKVLDCVIPGPPCRSPGGCRPAFPPTVWGGPLPPQPHGHVSPLAHADGCGVISPCGPARTPTVSDAQQPHVSLGSGGRLCTNFSVPLSVCICIPAVTATDPHELLRSAHQRADKPPVRTVSCTPRSPHPAGGSPCSFLRWFPCAWCHVHRTTTDVWELTVFFPQLFSGHIHTLGPFRVSVGTAGTWPRSLLLRVPGQLPQHRLPKTPSLPHCVSSPPLS